MLALLGTMAACGSDDEATPADDPLDAEQSAAEEPVGEEPVVEKPSAEQPADPEQPAENDDSVAPETTDPPGEDDATADPDATRIVETSFGPVELPVDPERVIALDEYAAMNLLAVGIEPIQTIGSHQSLVSQEILGDRGVEVIEQTDAFTVNFEAIAAAQPDVIVVTAESAFVSQVEPLQEIAPTVIVPYTSPWRDVIIDTGDLFGRPDEAARVVAAVEQRLAEVAEMVAADPYSLSILGETFSILFAVSPEAPLSAVVEEVGITRPAAQADGEPMVGVESVISISTELITDHDADVVAVMSGVFYDPDVVTEAPTYQALGAVTREDAVVVDGDMWFGTHPFAVYWILEELANLADGLRADGIGDLDDTDERWADYLELIG